MKINFTAEALKKPENLSVKAALAWDYLQINSGCWLAAEVSNGGIVVCDESAELEDARFFCDEADFLGWLVDVADDHLSGTEADQTSFLIGAGLIHPSVASGPVVSAVLASLNGSLV